MHEQRCRRVVLALAVLLAVVGGARGQGNLLRNGDFQDDWLTLLPELKNHHWNYTTEVFNRRDFNPDGWRLSGKWQWLDADRPAGQRRLILSASGRAVQAVNWTTVNNPRKLAGWPDAGGYPSAEFVRSKHPLALVRDLTLRVRLSGRGVPKNAGKIIVALASTSPIDDPLGDKRTISASVPLPEGTYTSKTAEVVLTARAWLEAAKKDPQPAAAGVVLPGAVVCEIACSAGAVEVHEATLTEPGPASPNLLPDGGFERLDAAGYPAGWSRPAKYRYFPPGLYYIFNTWHNSNSDNRGPVLADTLVPLRGARSLKMILATGDEKCVTSAPVVLNQKEPRLIEASAWVKTDQVCMIQLDAEDEKRQRLDCFNFIHKNPLSIGSNDWRLIRQVFRPAAPIKEVRLKLCARGMNGYTLDDTGHIPQQNATGTVWWDEVRLHEPETSAAELTTRGVKLPAVVLGVPGPHLSRLDLGERLFGHNELTAEVVRGGDRSFKLEWEFTSPSGRKYRFTSPAVAARPGVPGKLKLAYTVEEVCPAYSEYRGTLRLLDRTGKVVAESPQWFTTWTVSIDLELGALYLRPEQKQFVRLNLGLASADMARLKAVKLDVVRRGTGQVLRSVSVPATPDDIAARRGRIPDGLREDFRNLFLADLDVSYLPLQPFHDPQRNWLIRATAIDQDGKPAATTNSASFCRLGHDAPQPPIRSVKIDADGLLYVNDKPWMPWGVTYGHNPVYDGPADSGRYHDLHNLKPWSMYDRHGGNLAARKLWDANCLRYVEGGGLVKQDVLETRWKEGLYASTLFVPPMPGKPWPDDYLRFIKGAAMVVSVSPGPEETFGYFSGMTAKQLAERKSDADYLRRATGKPVMVGHGGYWTRLEFEKVPFYDIYDPETEPLYPAPLHTDLRPLVAGKPKVVWLRPQMYEDVPFERWRFHAYVELMRGARGWQLAHGPGDASTFRGLHGEMAFMQPVIYSKEKTPEVRIEPPLEHLVRRHKNKTYIVAASTHGMTFGTWRWSPERSPAGRSRVTSDRHEWSDESNGYNAGGGPPAVGPCPHGLQNLIDPHSWPAGSKLTTWVKLDSKATPKGLVALVKCDGRWMHAATWGAFDVAGLRRANDRAHWFLRTFYRHSSGFLGWGSKVPPHCLEYVPGKAVALGTLPTADRWVKLEVPLAQIGAAGKLLDGVAFMHEGGRAWWSQTTLVTPDGKEQVVFGDHEDRPSPQQLAQTRIHVAGLKKGTKVRVLFKDRELVAEDGFFVDDFRGVDLYQHFGGQGTGYGNAPVALHVYEVP
jgi:hypothetical protein